MNRFNRLFAICLAAGALATSGCRSTHTTVIEPVRQDHPDDHRDHPPPPPPHRDDHR